VLFVLGVGVAIVVMRAPGDISHPNVEFTLSTPVPRSALPRKHRRVVGNFLWPFYSYDAARTRFFSDGHKLGPPLRRGWRFNDHSLLEFPPVIYQNAMYFVDFNGSSKAISTINGHLIWRRSVGILSAASPAIDVRHKLVFVPLVSATRGARGTGNGRFVALSMKTGRVIWSRIIPPGSESSPLVHGLSVFVGDKGGTVYSFRTYDGHVNWTHHASGAVKGGLAFADGDLYFGDYAGRAYALNPATGQQIWAASTNGALFGFGSGSFYATPAVAFGRVYMGNTDHRVYSFAQRSGELAWATETGAYVYSSTAVADVPGLGPTVYAGSYDGNLYAFDARSGAIRWTHPSGGRISGSPTIVGAVVYYSVLGSRTTIGLDLRTGRQVFSFRDGAFASVIADDHAIYLIGYSTIYQLLPKRESRAKTRSRPQRASHRSRPRGSPRRG
jgi:outer membrane protein assembly factor BamB